jgi:hypothetical protein
MLAGMKKNNIAIGVAVAAALLLPSITRAAESHRCAAIPEDGPRLACYDGAFGRPARPAVAPAAPAASSVPTLPAAPRVVAPMPAAAPVAPPAQPVKPKEGPVSAKIVAVGQLSNDRFSVTLDNGQLWMQLERDVGAEVRVGDTVTLRPAMLGSWILETRAGIRTRVRLAR